MDTKTHLKCAEGKRKENAQVEGVEGPTGKVGDWKERTLDVELDVLLQREVHW